jgi:signal transduction histidine kinase
MDFNLFFIFLTFVSFLSLFFGFFVFLRQEKNIITLFFLFLCTCTSFWALSILLSWTTEEYIDFWSNATFIGPIILIWILFLFSLVFPNKKETFNKKIIILSAIPPLVVVFLAFSKLINIKTYSPLEIERGFGIHIFSAVFIFYALLSFFSFLKSFKVSSGKTKIRIKLISIGLFLAIFIGALFNLFLPLIFGNMELTILGPSIAGLIFIIFTGYAIIKHNIFKVHVIATEILIFALWVILAFKTVTADSPQDFFISGFILMATIFIGVFLIRSVTKEVHQREEIEKLAARVEKANERLRKVDKIKTEFMSIVSHQLRTPLSIVKGHLSMIQEGLYDKEPEKKAKILNDVYEANERLIGLVNDVLNASRIQSGRVEISKEKADITKVIKDVVEKLMPSAKEKGLKMIFHEPEKQIPKINIDVSKVENILINFIDNAIKYTNDGSVEVYLHQEEDGVVISIKDTGDGMNQEELEKLFETFSRGGAGKKYWIQGAGLGLYIARRFVEMHGGKTWAESEGKGKGSSFYIKLPI